MQTSPPGAGSMELVSVVVPCHNAAPFVAETLESVLAQTYPAVEAVVVDDASTDGSWEVVKRFTDRWPERVRALRLESNRGGCFARNRGAELARGNFLMFLDADDYVTPRAMAALVPAVRSQPGALAAGDSCRLEFDAAAGWKEAGPNARLPHPDPDEALRGWLDGSAWVPTCALLWRRDVYESTGGWDESVARNQDGDIAMRALVNGARIIRVPEMAGFYRMHGDARMSVSRNFVHVEKLRSQLKVIDRIDSILVAQGRRDAFAQALAADYESVALQAFQNMHWQFGRECLARARRLGGRRTHSATLHGRALERVLGMEGKERVAQALARAGLMSAGRRTLVGLRARASADGAP
jgi:glycosyltransferase involved in cell wall biosynthesis